MSVIDILSMALMNLWRRKLRAILTMLGMAIGTTSIVVMVSLGIGMNKTYLESIQSMGSLTKIQVSRSYEATGSKIAKLNDAAVRSIKAIAGIESVTPVVGMNSMAYIKSGKYSCNAQIIGIDLETAEDFGIKMIDGKLPKKARKLDTVEVLASVNLPNNFSNYRTYAPALNTSGEPKINLKKSKLELTYDYNNVTGKTGGTEGVTVKKGKFYPITVTGTCEENNEYYNAVFIDISTAKLLAKDNKDFIYRDAQTGDYDQIWVKADSVESVETVSAAIKKLGFGTFSLNDILNQVKESSKQIQGFLGAIGAVSMVVAAIGIANTMLMSIYERTKEIGVIKVLGCSLGNICALFLAEAFFIGLFGGGLGIALSYLMQIVLNTVMQSMGMSSDIPLWLALGALGFSGAVAMLSGLYPTFRAMKLSPLAAIRSE